VDYGTKTKASGEISAVNQTSFTVDTSIIVDLLRGYTPAKIWADEGHFGGLSRIVWFEVVQGTQSKAEQKIALDTMQRFELFEVTHDDLITGANLLMNWRPKLRIDAFDCILCATVLRLQLPFYTRNLKHFSPILGGLAIAPY